MIKLIDLESNPDKISIVSETENKEEVTNYSWIIGGNYFTLVLGIYEDKEKKLLSFLHEIGHITVFDDPVENLFNKEEQAWATAYKIANILGLEFSEETKQWAREQLESYEERQDQ